MPPECGFMSVDLDGFQAFDAIVLHHPVGLVPLRVNHNYAVVLRNVHVFYGNCFLVCFVDD
jgi:hypothetical protein